MIPAWFFKPKPTPDVDSGNSGTTLPALPYYTYDGSNSAGSTNPSLDGGNAGYMPVISHDGGCA